MRFRAFVLLAVVSLPAVGLAAEPRDRRGTAFFEKKIRPVLEKHCYECHSVRTEREGGLALDSREGIRRGGKSKRPMIVPGKPEESLLIQAVRYRGLKMPPKDKGQLPAKVIADLEEWVRIGAPDPREDGASPHAFQSWEEALQARRGWWSLQPVRKPAVPTVKNATWSDQPVDRFLLAELEKRGLGPAAEADRAMLVRRLFLVLTGLPPTAEEVEAFVRDPAADAYERLVERLLASPHYGECRAREWLDVVRFSETHGKGENYDIPHAWRYRDYLVRAFNEDVPYDWLVREHIAGDLLQPRWNRRERLNEAVIGTFFWRPGEVDHEDCIGFRELGFDRPDNQIDTFAKTFQATTVACARCHNHKIDAVSTKDYHRLLGIVRSSRQVSHTVDAPEVNAAPMERLRQLKRDIRAEVGAVWLRQAGETGAYLLAAQAKLANREEAAELARGLDAGRLERWVKALGTPPSPKVYNPILSQATVQPAQACGEDLFAPWRQLAGVGPPDLSAAWRRLADRCRDDARKRGLANRKAFQDYADFRNGTLCGWRADGHGLRTGSQGPGDLVLHAEGDALVRSVLPAGCFTHSLSDKLNGTLQSPVFPARTHRYISFLVAGQHQSAVRLVVNNCQLAYVKYRPLWWDEPHWVTMTLPEDLTNLRVYAELMTLADNPKFPDSLARLAGDGAGHDWAKLAANPRSYFGVLRVVLHDQPAVPQDQLAHWFPLFEGDAPKTLAEWAARYQATAVAAVQRWHDGQATDDDVRWTDALLRRGLLDNRVNLTPRLAELAGRYRTIEKTLAWPRTVPGMADFGPGFDHPILVRGDCTRPGEMVPRGYLEVLGRPDQPFRSAGSGRLELAERVASPSNPFTARVMVNRVWHHLFGVGLVPTVDDFGRYGTPPSHPELLDYLAARFVEDGWSLKRLVRTLVMTRAFRMSNHRSPAAVAIDPANRWLHHYPARRLEAENIRDAILAVSGRLDRTLYGPSIDPFREKEDPERHLLAGPLDGNGRRSLYIKNTLLQGAKFLGAFDFPGGKVTQGQRDRSNVPTQALTMQNDPFVVQQAARWAERMVARPDRSVAARVEHMFLAALGRAATIEEARQFERAVLQLAAENRVPTEELLQSVSVWQAMAHAFFNLQEFIFVP